MRHQPTVRFAPKLSRGACQFPPSFVTNLNTTVRGQDRMLTTIRSAAALSIIFLYQSAPAELTVSGHAAVSQSTNSTQATTPNPADPAPTTSKELSFKSFTLAGNKVWTDTGMTLEPGQRVVVTADGKLRYSDAKIDNGPDGRTRGFKDLIRVLPLNSQGLGALIAKIGDPDVAEPFLLGASKDISHQTESDTSDGSYTVKFEVYASQFRMIR
jgi:hypothetical protein